MSGVIENEDGSISFVNGKGIEVERVEIPAKIRAQVSESLEAGRRLAAESDARDLAGAKARLAEATEGLRDALNGARVPNVVALAKPLNWWQKKQLVRQIDQNLANIKQLASELGLKASPAPPPPEDDPAFVPPEGRFRKLLSGMPLKDNAANFGRGALTAFGALLSGQGVTIAIFATVAGLALGPTVPVIAAVAGGLALAALGSVSLAGASRLAKGRPAKLLAQAAGVAAGIAIFIGGIFLAQNVANAAQKINFPQPGYPSSPVSELQPLSPEFAKAGIKPPAGMTFAPPSAAPKLDTRNTP